MEGPQGGGHSLLDVCDYMGDSPGLARGQSSCNPVAMECDMDVQGHYTLACHFYYYHHIVYYVPY